jgi:hypothetical protein
MSVSPFIVSYVKFLKQLPTVYAIDRFTVCWDELPVSTIGTTLQRAGVMSAAGAKVIIICQRTATVRAIKILCFGDNLFQKGNVFRFTANRGRPGVGLKFRFRHNLFQKRNVFRIMANLGRLGIGLEFQGGRAASIK